jgi:ribosomal protein L44E
MGVFMIHHTCFKCKRRFELDPVFVGFELSKLKVKNPSHYQAVCPACRATNKVSVEAMQAELDEVADEIQAMVEAHEAAKAEARAEKQAKAKKAKAAKAKN